MRGGREGAGEKPRQPQGLGLVLLRGRAERCGGGALFSVCIEGSLPSSGGRWLPPVSHPPMRASLCRLRAGAREAAGAEPAPPSAGCASVTRRLGGGALGSPGWGRGVGAEGRGGGVGAPHAGVPAPWGENRHRTGGAGEIRGSAEPRRTVWLFSRSCGLPLRTDIPLGWQAGTAKARLHDRG